MSGREADLETKKFINICNQVSDFLNDFNRVKPMVRVKFHSKLFKFLCDQIKFESNLMEQSQPKHEPGQVE